jgi:hypothetical protein
MFAFVSPVYVLLLPCLMLRPCLLLLPLIIVVAPVSCSGSCLLLWYILLIVQQLLFTYCSVFIFLCPQIIILAPVFSVVPWSFEAPYSLFLPQFLVVAANYLWPFFTVVAFF